MGRGIAAAVMLGALKGGGEALSYVGKTEMESEEQRAKEAALAKREERLLALRQGHETTQNELTRSHQSTLAAQERGSREQMHSESLAATYTGQARTAEQQKAALEEQRRHAEAMERIAGKNADTSAKATEQAGATIQTNADGELIVVKKDGTATKVTDADGNVVVGTKDLSQRDQNKAKILAGLIKEDTETVAKTFDPETKKRIAERIDKNSAALFNLLGLATTAPAAPAASGGKKPWERSWGTK